MADPLYRVELTASFLERLDAIEAFLVEADAAFAVDRRVDRVKPFIARRASWRCWKSKTDPLAMAAARVPSRLQ